MPESPTPLTADRVLAGRYRLVGPLARGGMAEVWEGRDDVLDRPVAIKILHRHLADDDAFVARFRREAVAAARLSHPGIVATFDTGTDDGAAFIVMELVRGRTLRQRLIESGPQPVSVVVDIGRQVADALGHAHRAGIVHRDVKPANILLVEEAGRIIQIKVADFGIATLLATGSDLTQTGMMIGTAKYLSPEQVEGRSPDARSDVYALGVVLYEALSGHAPFEADTELATALMHVRSTPTPPGRLRAGVPAALEAVVLDALAKDPNERIASAAHFRARLDEIKLADVPDGAAAITGEASPGHGAGPTVDDRDNTAESATAVRQVRRPDRRTIAPVLIGVALLALLATIAIGAMNGRTGTGTGGGEQNASTAPSGQPVTIAAVDSFDPFGDDEENENRVALAVDGKPETAWPTDRYSSRTFGNLKPGVGLVVRLPGPATLHQLEITSPTRGWAAAAYLGDGSATDLAGWGAPVDTQSGLGSTATFNLRGGRDTAVLIWITDPGEGNRAELGEVRLFG